MEPHLDLTACLRGQVQPIPGGENLGDDLAEALLFFFFITLKPRVE